MGCFLCSLLLAEVRKGYLGTLHGTSSASCTLSPSSVSRGYLAASEMTFISKCFLPTYLSFILYTLYFYVYDPFLHLSAHSRWFIRPSSELLRTADRSESPDSWLSTLNFWCLFCFPSGSCLLPDFHLSWPPSWLSIYMLFLIEIHLFSRDKPGWKPTISK